MPTVDPFAAAVLDTFTPRPTRKGHDTVIATTDTPPPTRCADCGADEMGCAIKSGLSGRRCCAGCTHQTTNPANHGHNH
jgi:hypothetical protein